VIKLEDIFRATNTSDILQVTIEYSIKGTITRYVAHKTCILGVSKI